MLRDLRVKVRNRHSRISSCGFEELVGLSKQFFAFLNGNSVSKAIVDELVARNPESVKEAQTATGAYGETAEQAATIAYVKWSMYASQDNPHFVLKHVGHPKSVADALDKFRDWYVEPFFDYLDEVLDDENVVLAMLIRYKQKVEWYRRAELGALYASDTSHGEKNLARHMYEFLFDQGLPFHVEPVAASGRPDVISLDNSEHPFIGDVKIFDAGSRGSTYVKKGLYQVYRYCWDYNQPIGHLIVFNVSSKQLRLELPSQPDGVPRFEYNHKTIFITVIDVHEHEGTASTRGIAETVTITADELVREVETEPQPETETKPAQNS